jgi:hypothetical protein
MNIAEEKVFQIAEKLADEVFGKEGMEKYSERQVLTVELNKILTTELEKSGVTIIAEHDIVETKIEKNGVPVKSKGTVIHIYKDGEAFEVEFAQPLFDIRNGSMTLTFERNEITKTK